MTLELKYLGKGLSAAYGTFEVLPGFDKHSTVILKVFTNPAGTSGAYRGPCASMPQPQPLGSWVFTCHVMWPGLLWDMHGGDALGRVFSLLTQSTREWKEL